MEVNPDTMRFVWEAAKTFEQDMIQHKREGDKIAERTVVVVKNGTVILIFIAVLIFIAIVTFTREMRAVVTSMMQMNQLFECVSNSMEGITLLVGSVENNIQGVPIITSSMSSMADNLAIIQDNMHKITGDVVRIDIDIAATSNSVKKITNRMEHLTYTVHGMQYNLNQISRPIQSLNNWPMPFP